MRKSFTNNSNKALNSGRQFVSPSAHGNELCA